MPDKKLTDVTDNKFGEMSDSEIVKALECCIKWKREGDCAKCPLYESDKLCVKEIRILALDLINRLQAENEKLKEEKSKLENKIDEIYPLVMQLPNAMQQAKAEAYKECLEKIEQRDVSESDFYVMVKKTEFNNLLKELVGEDNA